jgi:protein-tyrosine phosphatase
MDVPDSYATMLSIMAAIRTSIESGPAVYIHCWGGIGRTGTVVGCWLRECGHDSEAALEQVQHLYSSHMPKANAGKYPESPQTEAQKNYVRRWSITRRPVRGAEVEFDRACVSPRAEGDES